METRDPDAGPGIPRLLPENRTRVIFLSCLIANQTLFTWNSLINSLINLVPCPIPWGGNASEFRVGLSVKGFVGCFFFSPCEVAFVTHGGDLAALGPKLISQS